MSELHEGIKVKALESFFLQHEPEIQRVLANELGARVAVATFKTADRPTPNESAARLLVKESRLSQSLIARRCGDSAAQSLKNALVVAAADLRAGTILV